MVIDSISKRRRLAFMNMCLEKAYEELRELRNI
jgi:hypothetical protein